MNLKSEFPFLGLMPTVVQTYAHKIKHEKGYICLLLLLRMRKKRRRVFLILQWGEFMLRGYSYLDRFCLKRVEYHNKTLIIEWLSFLVLLILMILCFCCIFFQVIVIKTCILYHRNQIFPYIQQPNKIYMSTQYKK